MLETGTPKTARRVPRKAVSGKPAATKADAKKTAAKKAGAGKAAAPKQRVQAIKKAYLKTKPVCKVTFKLPKAAAQGAKRVCLVGDFNNWSIHEHVMKKNISGDYSMTLELETGRDYQFRYLIDETTWENDWNADRYVRSPFGDSDNSVVTV